MTGFVDQCSLEAARKPAEVAPGGAAAFCDKVTPIA
jgi:hypothetical protein